MIKKLSYIISDSVNPYYNIGLEKQLLDSVENDEVILYLWQNKHTVVCGRNQNVYKECNLSKLSDDGVFLAKRLSGGGAVFHDLGNLNFTFLVSKENYCLEKQLDVICNACKNAGINAQVTGRNDITIDGKKFSGNAFYDSGNNKYHHGTLMISVKKEDLSKYLNVDKEKLLSKGVTSVQSRVVNLSEYNSELDINMMKKLMINAFEQTYNLPVKEYKLSQDDLSQINKNKEFFESSDWLYGKNIKFDYQINKRFAWGNFDLNIESKHGIITNATIYSDANDEAYIRAIADNIKGSDFSYNALAKIIDDISKSKEQIAISEDIKKMLFEAI